MVLACTAVYFSPSFSLSHIDGLAIAIALTTTALGTLMPILKERKLEGTQVGNGILAFGTWGELCPVLAMALLLSARKTWQTLLILALFGVLCVVMAVVPSKARKAGHGVYGFLHRRRNSTSQTFVRVTVVLLIGLVTVSAVFDLDIVLGAFAAGFATSSPKATMSWNRSSMPSATASSRPSSSWCPARRSTWRAWARSRGF